MIAGLFDKGLLGFHFENTLSYSLGCHFTFLKKFFFSFVYFWLPGSLMLCSLSLVAVSGGYSLVVVHRLLIAVASLIAEHRL